MFRLESAFLLVVVLLCAGCDSDDPTVDPPGGGANPAYAGRYVGTWAEEETEAFFILSVFLAPEQGQMVGTGSVTRRLVVGGGFEETSFPLTVSGRIAEDTEEPTVELNGQLPTGQLLVISGTGQAGADVIEGELVGATPYGLHDVEEFVLRRE